MELDLVIPQALSPSRALLDQLREAPECPGLRRLIRRGDTLQAAHHPWADTPLDPVTGYDSAAALALLGEGQTPGEGYWLRADPVHLLPDYDHAIVWDAALLELDRDEAEALVTAFNEHFAEDELVISCTAPGRWYLRCPHPLELRTVAPEWAAGRNAFHCLPDGGDGARLRTWMTETQMLFHDHPVNEARRRQGRLEVSGVWFWGGGGLPGKADLATDVLWSENPLSKGLARMSGVVEQDLPTGFEAWRARAGAGRHLLVPEQGSVSTRRGDGEAWHEALQALDRDWIRPAVQAVEQGGLARLRLWSGPDRPGYCYRRAHRLRFWRRGPGLRTWLDRQSELEEVE